MKLFSEYIIMETDYTERNQKIKDKLINIFYILQLNNVINLSSDKELKTSYNELVKQCKSALNKILVNDSKLDKVLNKKFDLLLKNNFDYSGKKATEFDNLTVDIQEKIKTFISKLDGLKSSKNESLNESDDSTNIVSKLKAELERVKDVQFDDDNNNFYKIGQRLLDNYESFKDTMTDDNKKNLEDKINTLIDNIHKVFNTTDTHSNNVNNTDNTDSEKIEQTETTVIESRFIKGIKENIDEFENIETDSLNNVFNTYATDDIKNDPKGKEYLGLTIITLGAILLKKQDEHNWPTQILNITKNN